MFYGLATLHKCPKPTLHDLKSCCHDVFKVKNGFKYALEYTRDTSKIDINNGGCAAHPARRGPDHHDNG